MNAFSVVFKNGTASCGTSWRRRRETVAGDCALGADEWANFLNYGIGTIALFPRTPAAPGKLLNLISKCLGDATRAAIRLALRRVPRDQLYRLYAISRRYLPSHLPLT